MSQLAGRDDGHAGRVDDRRRITAREHAEVGQHDGVVLEVFRRDGPVAGVVLEPIQRLAQLRGIG
ncbi:hypothetical protein D3C83_287400 [compost metagenome]